MQIATTESYGQAITRGIEARVTELLTEIDSTPDGWAYEIEDIRERCEQVDEAARRGDFDALRRSKNGRELLALWQARNIWRKRNAQPQDEFDGYPPQPEDARALQQRAGMLDAEFAYLARFEASDEDYMAWDAESAFITNKTTEARAELLALLRARGVDPRQRAVKLWVERRMKAKSHNRLRAYRSCIAIIGRGYWTGFAYQGWRPRRD